MIGRLLGDYLIENGVISREDLLKVFDKQKQTRAKLGLIGVAQKMLTEAQADEVNRLQSVMDKRFGDIAVEKGYLTDEQVGQLLKLQGDPYLSFAQTLQDLGYIANIGDLDKEIVAFQKKNELSDDAVEALKSDDPDKYVPLFIPDDCEEYYMNLIILAVKSIIRLIDSDIYIGKTEEHTSFNVDYIASQSLDGDKKSTLCFTAKGDGILKIASIYGQEDFKKIDLDALDAASEFINCINGMYATKVSDSYNVDMKVPVYKDYPITLSGNKVYSIPVYFDNSEVRMLVALDENMNI